MHEKLGEATKTWLSWRRGGDHPPPGRVHLLEKSWRQPGSPILNKSTSISSTSRSWRSSHDREDEEELNATETRDRYLKMANDLLKETQEDWLNNEKLFEFDSPGTISISSPDSGIDSSDPERYRTELCKNFPLGKCTFGDQCRFAHGLKHLRRRVRLPEFKSKLCDTTADPRSFKCLYNTNEHARCNYIHPGEATRCKCTREYTDDEYDKALELLFPQIPFPFGIFV